ncbi:MAG: relaxase/mobilization nuclease domain-containing protein [Bacteroidota bacterium]
MIIKIKSRKSRSYRQLLKYLLTDEERVPDSRIILHNMPDGSINDWVGWYKYNETFRKHKRKNNVLLTHEILSWHKDDTPNLSIEAIEDMAREYIEKRNPLGIYVGTIHLSKEHYHVHFCVSGLEYRSGKSMRLSRTDLKELKQSVQAYQQEKYPELVHSVVDHGNSKKLQLTDREYYHKQRTGGLSTREKLSLLVDDVLQKAKDIDDFLGSVASQGLKPYFRNEKLMGIWFNNRKYRFKKLAIDTDRLQKLIELNLKRDRSR